MTFDGLLKYSNFSWVNFHVYIWPEEHQFLPGLTFIDTELHKALSYISPMLFFIYRDDLFLQGFTNKQVYKQRSYKSFSFCSSRILCKSYL